MGDKVKEGDVIAEVETDKATMEWVATEDGYVAKLLIPEGAKDVPVNAVRNYSIIFPSVLILFYCFYFFYFVIFILFYFILFFASLPL